LPSLSLYARLQVTYSIILPFNSASKRCQFSKVVPGIATLQRGFGAGLEPGAPRGKALVQDFETDI